MFFPDELANFISSYQDLIIWLGAIILFFAFARAMVNMGLGIKKLLKKHNPF